MRLIDADEAVQKVQKQIAELKKELRRIEEIPAKNKYDLEVKRERLINAKAELASRADLLSILAFECKEIKVNTKEKE